MVIGSIDDVRADPAKVGAFLPVLQLVAHLPFSFSTGSSQFSTFGRRGPSDGDAVLVFDGIA